jgi:CheY-like chemotaxis protein
MLHRHIQPILLVEDEPDDASFVRRALARNHIANELITCTTVEQATGFIDGRDADKLPVLAIVDMYLPNGKTGLEFLTWLRAQRPPAGDMAAMMYSVSSDLVHRQQASALKSVIYLEKPATEETLALAVQALGFVVTSTSSGGRARRVIQPR